LATFDAEAQQPETEKEAPTISEKYVAVDITSQTKGLRPRRAVLSDNLKEIKKLLTIWKTPNPELYALGIYDGRLCLMNGMMGRPSSMSMQIGMVI
jgi:hypothetical protein